MFSLPNLLTLSRIVIIPFFVLFCALDSPLGNKIAFSLYTLACITDFFDGYLARARLQVSSLGRFLDPIADKLLIASALMILTNLGRIEGISILPALIILCREILVSGLREFLAELQEDLPVSQLAKWKTGIQMVALGLLTLGKSKQGTLPFFEISGLICLWGAGLLTLITGYDYLREGLKRLLK